MHLLSVKYKKITTVTTIVFYYYSFQHVPFLSFVFYIKKISQSGEYYHRHHYWDAGGTFLFVATAHMLPDVLQKSGDLSWPEVCSIDDAFIIIEKKNNKLDDKSGSLSSGGSGICSIHHSDVV